MSDWEIFTEKGYRSLLDLAKERYRFADYTDPLDEDGIILWRHDVDYSVHRAYRLAQIERDAEAKATYFLQLSCIFYNLFESRTLALVKSMIGLGHSIGLHFDPSLYTNASYDECLEKMQWEKEILQRLFDAEVRAVSFHNPETGNWLSVDRHELCGMINAYSRRFRENFGYCSDSNGYWRFESIDSVLRNGQWNRLQVLTHPAWWTPEPLPPRKRIERCVDGRAVSCMKIYDDLLRETGRENIG